MGLSADEKLRQACWQTIGSRVRNRLVELAGGIIEWDAHRDDSSPDGRPYAVVFGDRGLSLADPQLSARLRPVYAVSAFAFFSRSLRHVRVDHRPPPYAASRASGPVRSPGPTAPGFAVLGLSADTQGVLGNLPPRAQELLQAPFADGQRVLRCQWGYEGSEHGLSMFLLYLAGPRDVTVAVGTSVIPPGHTTATAHWSLMCYRAAVARRIGR